MRTLIIVVLAIYASTAAAEIYSWKDADGKVHYSDQAPAGATSSVKTLPTPPETTPTPAYRPRPVVPAEKTTDKSAGTEKAPTPNPQSACDNAKTAMQNFLDRPRRTAVSAGGKFYALDGEERAEEEAKLQKAIDSACK